MAVAFCVCGDLPSVVRELEISIKSLLHTAPRRSRLEVLVVADRKGADAIERSLTERGADGSTWPSELALHILDVENQDGAWEGLVRSVCLP